MRRGGWIAWLLATLLTAGGLYALFVLALYSLVRCERSLAPQDEPDQGRRTLAA